MPRVIMGDFNSVRKAGAPPVLCAVGYLDCSMGDDTATYVKFDDSRANSGAKNHLNWIFARGANFDNYTVYDNKYSHSDGQRRNLSDHVAIGIRLHLVKEIKSVAGESVYMS